MKGLQEQGWNEMKRKTSETTHSASSDLASLHHALVDKRIEVMQGLGAKFDALASMGRVAEEDQAQMSHDEYIGITRNKQDYEVLKLVNEAIDRLNTGDFGACQRCEEPIAPRRLQVLPWAKYCVRCQERISSRDAEEDSPVAVHEAW